MKKIIYPGSFDPITLGHIDIIERLAKTYDYVYVLVANDNTKTYMFDLATRKRFAELATKNYANVSVYSTNGLTTDFAKEKNCYLLARGVRNKSDIEHEKWLLDEYHKYDKNIDIVYLEASPNLINISSTYAREKIKNKESLENILPKELLKEIPECLN